MAFGRSLSILLTLCIAAEMVGQHACPQTQANASCTTCTPQEFSELVVLATGASMTATAWPCANMPTGNCHNCCWQYSMSFNPGTGTVDYGGTYVKVGAAPPITTAHPELAIAGSKQVKCTAESASETCLKFQFTITTGAGQAHAMVVCWKLGCGLCVESV